MMQNNDVQSKKESLSEEKNSFFRTLSSSRTERSDLGRNYSQGYEFMKGMLTNPSKTLPHSDFRRALGHLEYHTRQRVREQFRLVGAYWYFKGWLWASVPSSGSGTDGGAGDHDQNDDTTAGCLYASGHPQNDPADSLTPGCAKSIGTGNQ